jgi:hypothetical protein
MSSAFHRTVPVFPVVLLLAASCSQGQGDSGGGGTDGGAGGGSSGAAGSDDGPSGSSSGASGSSGTSGSSGIGGGTSGGGSGSSSSGTGSSGASSSSSSSSGSASSGSSSSSGSSGSSSSGTGGDGGAKDSGATSSACTKAKATCNASNTGCNLGSYYLYDNQWNCGSGSGNHCGPESAYGCDDGNGVVSFVVTSNQPTGNTAVLSYPAIQDNFNSKPLLSSFSSISATFSETSPHVGDYEVAWDCWFNNNANELMIWVDNYNQVPAGTKVASNVALGGRSYNVWSSPSSGTGGYVVFYATATFTSGTVDLLQIFNYAASHGWIPTTSTVDQLSFGVEVCSTNDQDATWTFSNYSITSN